MIKQSIRLVGCIIALFALILVFKHSHLMQEEKPLNTTERFNIAVLSTTISKERLVNELNALVDQYGAVLVKVVPNQDNYDILHCSCLNGCAYHHYDGFGIQGSLERLCFMGKP